MMNILRAVVIPLMKEENARELADAAKQIIAQKNPAS